MRVQESNPKVVTVLLCVAGTDHGLKKNELRSPFSLARSTPPLVGR